MTDALPEVFWDEFKDEFWNIQDVLGRELTRPEVQPHARLGALKNY